MFKLTTIKNHGIPSVATYSKLVFSGGEVQVKITSDLFYMLYADAVTISADITNSAEIMELALLTNAIRNINPTIEIDLIMPYVPYARQDRVCAEGEALSLKVFANIINSLNFAHVTVWDVHSDVSLALLNNVKNVGPETFLQQILSDNTDEYVLVAPDAGAIKKVSKVAKTFGLPMITASKNRNPQTGEITGTQVTIDPAVVGDRKFLIVDDIIDGGATYRHLAEVIRNSGYKDAKIELYITHGIFSKGVDIMADTIDHIYVANLWPNVDQSHPLLTVLA